MKRDSSSMVQLLLVGLGAGVAAALLFASVVSASPLAIFLFYLAPLPILIASLGWSHLAGLVAAASATAVVGALSGAFFLAVAGIAFGAWWLGYLTLLAQPAANGSKPSLQWYPVGRLVLWAAAIGALVVLAAVPNFGIDRATLQAALRRSYAEILPDQLALDLLVIVVPPAAVVFSMITYLLNLWLAARVVKASGRLVRPWPDLSAMILPSATPALLLIAIAGSFLPDLLGTMSLACAASLAMVLALLGLAVLHSVTRGMSGRPFVLAGVYGSAITLGWPFILLALVGISEIVLGVRLRIARRRYPPHLST
jgi:hypothetical protein